MMTSWWRIALVLFLTINAINVRGDDEADVENADEDDAEVLPEVDPVPYVTPDIDPSVYFAEHFDSEESFGKKWIKSSAKKDGVESAIDR